MLDLLLLGAEEGSMMNQLQHILDNQADIQAVILGRLDALDIKIENSRPRLYNSHATRGHHQLKRIRKEQVGGTQPLGALPTWMPLPDDQDAPEGIFPRLFEQLRCLSHAQLNALALFYNEDFGAVGDDLYMRQDRFGDFIGGALR